MGLIRTLFWVVIFVAATFAFTVVFEHGPANFPDNAKKEIEILKKMIGAKPDKKKDTSDQLTPPIR